MEYHNIFSLDPLELGQTESAVHNIKLTNSTRFKERSCCIPQTLVNEVRENLEEMLDADVICPSSSP